LLRQRDVTKLYFCQRLELDKNRYLTMKSIDNQVVSVLVDVPSGKEYPIHRIVEKDFRIFFYTEDIVFTYRGRSNRWKEVPYNEK